LKYHFIHYTQVVFSDVLKTENEFSERVQHLKKPLSGSRQSRILDLPKAENYVAGCVETMKHRIIDFSHVVI
jgi:hypothetical protein